MEPEVTGWAIWLDISITRRKVYQSVTSPTGAVVFRSRFITECMAFLAAEGIDEYDLVPSPNRTLGGSLVPHKLRNPELWQK